MLQRLLGKRRKRGEETGTRKDLNDVKCFLSPDWFESNGAWLIRFLEVESNTDLFFPTAHLQGYMLPQFDSDENR